MKTTIKTMMAVTVLTLSAMVAGLEGRETDFRTKVLSNLAWDDVVHVVTSPSDIAKRVKMRVSYTADAKDEMKSGEKTWSEKTGDCEDFAKCVVELCKAKGFEAWVEVYSEDDKSKAHAVAMGRWNGRLWISSNGNFQFVENEANAAVVVAQAMGWRLGIVRSEPYKAKKQ